MLRTSRRFGVLPTTRLAFEALHAVFIAVLNKEHSSATTAYYSYVFYVFSVIIHVLPAQIHKVTIFDVLFPAMPEFAVIENL